MQTTQQTEDDIEMYYHWVDTMYAEEYSYDEEDWGALSEQPRISKQKQNEWKESSRQRDNNRKAARNMKRNWSE